MRKIKILISLFLFLTLFPLSTSFSQFEAKWLTAGSFHNWYSSIGVEIEHGLVAQQQYGWRWPAIYDYQDLQAAKGMWFGAKDFTDENGNYFPHKVVHVGPRVSGVNVFFPKKFELVSKFEAPLVYVDGVQTLSIPVDINRVDPNIKADRMIENVVNSQLGITMTRRIYQFSQQHHDNYIVSEYIFKNTGNTDADDAIELPNVTLKDVYFYFLYRLAPVADTRYVIGNATGWGMNTMNDARGDGVKVDPVGQQFRLQYSWHGRFAAFTQYDNLFGPIFIGYYDRTDTSGRIGAPHFPGILTLFASKSSTDHTDDILQPKTTMYLGSDFPLTSRNDPFNPVRMTQEYALMSYGKMSPRHADYVQPDGNFSQPTGDPAAGLINSSGSTDSGGQSFANGYGPYTIPFGDSIRIVFAEVVAGISRERAVEVGRQFKRGQITARQKNDEVFKGRDSLFQTARRATENFRSNWGIPQAPLPPKIFNVTSGGDRISLTWETFIPNDPAVRNFQIWRAQGKVDSTYYLIYNAGATERRFDDTTLLRGVSYYYYIVSVGDAAANTGVGATPTGPLASSRYYTQTYDPAFLKRQAGTQMSDIRIVPNPYSLGMDRNNLLFPNEQDKIAFFNIPGECRIKIFTELGELIQTINHKDGSGDAYWNLKTSSNQVVVSGIYIAVFENLETGEIVREKFVIIR